MWIGWGARASPVLLPSPFPKSSGSHERPLIAPRIARNSRVDRYGPNMFMMPFRLAVVFSYKPSVMTRYAPELTPSLSCTACSLKAVADGAIVFLSAHLLRAVRIFAVAAFVRLCSKIGNIQAANFFARARRFPKVVPTPAPRALCSFKLVHYLIRTALIRSSRNCIWYLM